MPCRKHAFVKNPCKMKCPKVHQEKLIFYYSRALNWHSSWVILTVGHWKDEWMGPMGYLTSHLFPKHRERRGKRLHSGFGWKLSDMRPENIFWVKWFRTFLHIHRDQPRPYLVIFWSHMLRSSGVVWRGRKKWPLLGHFCKNLEHTIDWSPDSKCRV